jgi:hypothetical protein
MFTEANQHQAELCDKPVPKRIIDAPPPLDIQANQTHVLQAVNGGWGITDDKLIRWPPERFGDMIGRAIFPILAGCVDYRSGAMPELHQTGFIYEIRHRLNQQTNTLIYFGKDVPQNEVILDPLPWGQGKVY